MTEIPQMRYSLPHPGLEALTSGPSTSFWSSLHTTLTGRFAAT